MFTVSQRQHDFWSLRNRCTKCALVCSETVICFSPAKGSMSLLDRRKIKCSPLQRKRILWLNPQRLKVTFALRPGRNETFTGLQRQRWFFSSPERPEQLLLAVPTQKAALFSIVHWSALRTLVFLPPMRTERLLLKVCSETITNIAECHWSAAKTSSIFDLQKTCFFYVYKHAMTMELSCVSERFLMGTTSSIIGTTDCHTSAARTPSFAKRHWSAVKRCFCWCNSIKKKC